MGVLPCQFMDGENAQTLGLKGDKVFDFGSLQDGNAKELTVTAKGSAGSKQFKVKVLLLTPKEIEFYRHGGLLKYVLRQLAKAA